MTPARRAFDSIKAGVSLEAEPGSQERRDAMDFIYSTIAAACQEAERQERLRIAAYLDELGDGRMDYVHKPETLTHGGAIEAMGGMQGTIYGEATGAKRLAKILRGELDDKGWLPSWRWKR